MSEAGQEPAGGPQSFTSLPPVNPLPDTRRRLGGDSVEDLNKGTPVTSPRETKEKLNERDKRGIWLLWGVLGILTLAIVLSVLTPLVSDHLSRREASAPPMLLAGPSAAAIAVAADAVESAARAGWPEGEPPRRTIALVKDEDGLSPGDRRALGECLLAGPSAEGRAAALACVRALDAAMQRRLAKEKAAQAQPEAMRKLDNEERAASHGFWLQLSQLVLVTVMVPIVTALLNSLFLNRAKLKQDEGDVG